MAMMTVAELIEILGDMDPTAEVRLAIQPTWPFEHRVGQVEEDMDAQVVYIAEAGQVGYLPGEVREWLGWEQER
jgi:hypothetical protein